MTASPPPDPHPPGPPEEPTGRREVDDPHGSRAEALEAQLGQGRSVTEVHRPSTRGGTFYLLVLLVALAGVVVAAAGAWRAGVGLLGGSLLAAAVARLGLRDQSAGMLQVRRKALDAALLILMGTALIVLAVSIPNQPGG